MTTNELLETLEWRYAVKKFDASKKIPENTWTAFEKSLVLTPSSYGLQPWKFLVIQDASMKKSLREFSWNQAQVEDCSHYVVCLGKKNTGKKDIENHIQRIHELRGTPLEKLEGFKKGMIGDLVDGARQAVIQEWAARQVYIALGQAMLSAALLKLDACPMEGIDPEAYDRLLKLENTEYKTLCALALGYRSEDDAFGAQKKVRFPISHIVERR